MRRRRLRECRARRLRESYVTVQRSWVQDHHCEQRIDQVTCSIAVGEMGYTCAADFCDECEFAGECDQTCSLCSQNEPPPETSVPTTTDAPPSRFCVLLTTAITPSQAMSNTKRWSPARRLRECRKPSRTQPLQKVPRQDTSLACSARNSGHVSVLSLAVYALVLA